jgi:hypothetical protein
MKKTKKLILGTLLLLAMVPPVQASTVTYNLTGDAIDVSITLHDDTAGLITFNVAVDPLSTFTGDLRGVFFNLTPFGNGITITGDLVTNVVVDQQGVTKAGPGSVIKPYGPFDVGVEIGTPGMGKDDIQTTTFAMADLGVFTLDSFGQGDTPFGIRLTSVGLPGGPRTESRKLIGGTLGGGPSENPVPAPASVLLICSGLAGLPSLRRKD